MSAERSTSIPPPARARRTVRVAVAAIATIPIVGCSSGASDEPTAEGTEAPPATAGAGTGSTYFAGGDSVPVTVTLPAGWEVDDVFVNKPGSDPRFSVSFWDVAEIFADPCEWVLVDPPVGPTVDDLVSAWANVPGLDATAASDVTVDGHEGKRFDLTVPDFDGDECRAGKFALWREDGQRDDGSPARWVEPDEHLQMWVLDVDGTRLVVSAGYYPDTSPQDLADIDEILSSIQIG